jgi:hypothetical protein
MNIITLPVLSLLLTGLGVAPAVVTVADAQSALTSACPNQGCEPAAEKAAAASIEDATKLATGTDFDGLVALRDALGALAPKSASPLGRALGATNKALTRLADAELKSSLDGRRWEEARSLVTKRGPTLGAAWEKKAHTNHGAALERFARATKPPTGLDELSAVADEYSPIVAAEGVALPVKKGFAAVQAALGKLADKKLTESLGTYDYAAAGQLVEVYSPRAGAPWTQAANAAIAKKRSVTTELVDGCSRSKTWDACVASMETLRVACSEDAFPCNPTARSALRQAFSPLVTRKDTTEEQRLALGHATEQFDKLKPNDPVKQLGQQAFGVVRREVEARVRRQSTAGEFAEARSTTAQYSSHFGEGWATKSGEGIDREEQRQQAIAEAQERAKMAACMGVCQNSIVSCDHDPWSLCHPAPSDCERTCRMVGGW